MAAASRNSALVRVVSGPGMASSQAEEGGFCKLKIRIWETLTLRRVRIIAFTHIQFSEYFGHFRLASDCLLKKEILQNVSDFEFYKYY